MLRIGDIKVEYVVNHLKNGDVYYVLDANQVTGGSHPITMAYTYTDCFSDDSPMG